MIKRLPKSEERALCKKWSLTSRSVLRWPERRLVGRRGPSNKETSPNYLEDVGCAGGHRHAEWIIGSQAVMGTSIVRKVSKSQKGDKVAWRSSCGHEGSGQKSTGQPGGLWTLMGHQSIEWRWEATNVPSSAKPFQQGYYEQGGQIKAT